MHIIGRYVFMYQRNVYLHAKLAIHYIFKLEFTPFVHGIIGLHPCENHNSPHLLSKLIEI